MSAPLVLCDVVLIEKGRRRECTLDTTPAAASRVRNLPPKAALTRLRTLLDAAFGRVSRFREGLHGAEELLALADEEPAGSETLDRSDCASKLIGQWTNDRDLREVRPEFAGNREDQAGLNQLVQRFEKVGECQAGYGVGKWCNRGLHAIAGKINPL